ncbi:di-heme oxidoredictase family protein [Roseibium marinum]|uniref:Di-heme oxidoreductase (Putative peroxidase) n=1 Tax=Roseibium marinum TaxID=281252 RepID=A0A2S3V170_9HYPH|nr:di-heme oxidoredictase family protein [Roseibium marinum]POF33721.1 di-heme oxidoreductase (putative peroxidase) [Roseibium marinum]
MIQIFRPAVIPFALAIALSIPLPAAVLADPDPEPWSERAIREDVDITALAASGEDPIAVLQPLGKRLFAAKFTTLDGAGRPDATGAIVPTKARRRSHLPFQRLAGMDANACASCHNEPVDGGAGAFTANVFVSEGFESADFDTIDPQFSNERNTNAIQGAGLIELLAREMTADLRRQRQDVLAKARGSGDAAKVLLETKGISFGSLTAYADGTLDVSGLDGIDDDLTLRPFSQKGVFASLRQFTVNAMNDHHGMQASERFGAAWTGTDDFDGDGHADELTPGQVSALVAWQATLPAPTRRADLPETWRQAAQRGETLFGEVGCSSCHIPELPLDSLVFQDPGPFDTAGTLRQSDVAGPLALDLGTLDWVKALPRDDQGRVLVPLFGDLKRHKIADAANDTFGNELLAQRFVARDVFMTAELWGIGSTAPYGHRGDLTTLNEVILAHGGEATESRKAYSGLEEPDRKSIIAFLRSLEIAE